MLNPIYFHCRIFLAAVPFLWIGVQHKAAAFIAYNNEHEAVSEKQYLSWLQKIQMAEESEVEKNIIHGCPMMDKSGLIVHLSIKNLPCSTDTDQ